MATKELKSDNYDNMDLAKLAEMRDQIEQAIQARATKEFEDDINYLQTRSKNFRREPADYVGAWMKLWTPEQTSAVASLFGRGGSGGGHVVGNSKAPRAPRGTVVKKATQDVDSTGARPSLNSTYKLEDGSEYKTGDQLRRTPGNFLAAIKAGKTWAELKK